MVALGIIVSHYLTKQMLDREWETTAKFIRTEVRQWLVPEDFKAKDLNAVAQKFQRLHQQVILMPNIVRIKVYNPHGGILWSDEKRLIGTSFASNPELKEALEGEVVAKVSPITKGENVYERGPFRSLVEVYVPIFAAEGREIIGVIETYRSAESLFQDIQRARLMIVLVGLLGGGGLYLSLFAIVRRASRKIGEQQRHLLTIQSELIASQRMAAIGEMAGAVAHGIGNPLASIRAAAQVAKLECADQTGCAQFERNQVSLGNIIQEVDRVERRIRGLLNFVRPLEPRTSLVDINLLLQDVVQGLRTRFKEAEVTLWLDLDPTLPKTPLDLFHIEQVFLGLLTNAIEATPPGGTVTVGAEVVSLRGNSPRIRISIEDTGEGIPPENRERVFEPFFTTKPHGTGLGLALAKKFVERNGGAIVILEGSKGGTRVEITFPGPGSNRG
jgi:signal transduction histidine kinase